MFSLSHTHAHTTIYWMSVPSVSKASPDNVCMQPSKLCTLILIELADLEQLQKNFLLGWEVTKGMKGKLFGWRLVSRCPKWRCFVWANETPPQHPYLKTSFFRKKCQHASGTFPIFSATNSSKGILDHSHDFHVRSSWRLRKLLTWVGTSTRGVAKGLYETIPLHQPIRI